ncbi:MAG: copper resistance protein CopC [Candidatus Methanomethyliaceae archaeon]
MSVDQSSSLEEILAKTRCIELYAEPILNHRSAPWIALKKGVLAKLKNAIGHAAYTAHEGAGLTPREAFIVQVLDLVDGHVLVKNASWKKAKIRISRELREIVEPQVLYRVMFGKDLKRWTFQMKEAFYAILLYNHKSGRIYTETVAKTRFPKAYSFLYHFRKEITSGANYKQFGKNAPFYFVYRVNDHTFAPFKVMWKEVGTKVDAVVVNTVIDPYLRDKLVIPDYTCVYVPLEDEDEAHYLCAILNSTISKCITSYIHLHPDPHILDYIKVPSFDRKNNLHMELAGLSKEAHDFSFKNEIDKLLKIEEEIDLAVAKLYGLTEEDLKEFKSSLKLLEGEEIEEEIVEEEPMEVTVDFLNAVVSPNAQGSVDVSITNPSKEYVKIEVQLPDRKVELETDKEQATVKVQVPPLKAGEYKIPYKIITQSKVARGEFTLHVKERKRFRKDETLASKLDELLGEKG